MAFSPASVDPLAIAVNLGAQMVLAVPRTDRTAERIRAIAATAATMARAGGMEVSPERVARELETQFDVWVPLEIVVSDPADHVPWLDRRKSEIDPAYWARYRAWLTQRRGWKPSVIEALDEATDQVLSLLEDPRRPGAWKVKGLVYGQVQSGKTASYTGVICKAVDAGYRVIVVLTSSHENLRYQTQARLDLEFLGFNTKFTRQQDAGSKQVGVGELGMRTPPICISVTTREKDFTSAVFASTPVDVNHVRLLVVSKKNPSVLRNLYDWLRNFAQEQKDGRRIITGLPLLLIDDEADYASVDTRRPRRGFDQSDPDHDPTTINQSIRDLLELFEMQVYLGYTATPFANIFIPHTTEHPEHGEDLFPRSFMIALEPPSDYCGPEMVFGLEDPAAEDVRQPIPVVRLVEDHDLWMPDKHRKWHEPDAPLPQSLVQAVDAFVLATAVRKARVQHHGLPDGHNSMLVHVTRYPAVQAAVARQLTGHLRSMEDTWGDHGEAGRQLRARLRALWDEDFLTTHKELADRDDVTGLVGPPVSYEQVEERIPEVLGAAANVKQINGRAEDVVDYQSSSPITVVVVGGDKLSRGLTLEGLTVSYYLRASRTYDTLLQMGRWFGYRPQYLDVTRLYTTQELVDYYVHVTRANRDLMDLVAAVARAGQTPRDVGLRVIDGYGRLQVTASAKMRGSTPLSFTFSGKRAETLVMRTDRPALRANRACLERLVESVVDYPEVPADLRHGAGRGFFRQDVPPEIVLEFLDGFACSQRVLQASPENLMQYIRAQVSKDELTRWTIAIAAGKAHTPITLGSQTLPTVIRKSTSGGHVRALAGEFEVGVLASPSHEVIGMPPAKVADAFRRTCAAFAARGDTRTPIRASGELLRELRDPTDGLLVVYPIDPVASKIEVPTPDDLIVGYAVIFPRSDRAASIQYRVNQVFVEGLVRSIEYDPDEEGE